VIRYGDDCNKKIGHLQRWEKKQKEEKEKKKRKKKNMLPLF
jgi:hypothetical protein